MALIDVARNGRTDAAIVAAANSLLNGGYWRPVTTEAPPPGTRASTVMEIRSPDLV